jgi:CBS domain-containing protein
MTPDPVTVAATSTAVEAARAMRDEGVRDVIVLDRNRICGILTDRDITVRGVALGRDPARTRAADLCSRGVAVLDPSQTVEEAFRLMQEKDMTRLPVVDDGRPVGIVSIDDVAEAATAPAGR